MNMQKDIGALIARLAFGGTMFLSHGLSKLMNFSQMMNSFPDPLGVGSSLSLGLTIFAEVGCAVLLALGLFTRWVSAPLIVTMLVAVVIFHSSDPWQKKELGFLYLCGFVICALIGSGRLSLDFVIRKKS